VDGHLYNTFKEACLAKGLLENDGEWASCLEEASVMRLGSQLRALFVTLLIHCSPNELANLWQQFWHQMCDDFRHQLQMQQQLEDPSEDYGLFLIDEILRNEYNKFLANILGMPQSIIP